MMLSHYLSCKHWIRYVLIAFIVSGCLKRGDELSSVAQMNRPSDVMDENMTGDMLLSGMEILPSDPETTGGDDLPREGLSMGGSGEAGEQATRECDPDLELGVCLVCDANGILSVPDSDPRCPSPVCSSEVYSTNANGLCTRTQQISPEDGLCESAGSCARPDDQPCTPISTPESIIVDEPCREVTLCEGDRFAVGVSPNGTPCNEWGACEDGICSAPSNCQGFQPQGSEDIYCRLDPLGVERDYCTFYLQTFGLETSCEEFCMSNNSTCINAWNEESNSCQSGVRIACNERMRDLICQCRAL